ncbi:MAG TPA: hypothetical protein VHE30_14000, partial [Polyangiaceae bacterium]|nr:hypothetical protein [Polyangiaceae bacterium]
MDPVPPFADWPVQLFLPDHGFYWYAHPAALVCQTVHSYATVAIVDAHNDVLDGVLRTRSAEIRAAGGILIFNDWRSIRGFAPGARSRMQERMNARERGYARKTVVTIHPGNRLLRMAIEAASLFKTMVLGSRIDVVLSPDVALARAGLTPPVKGEPFPRVH